MTEKSTFTLIFYLFFFSLLLTFVNAQQEATPRNVEIDGDSNPEFIIHWRYGDFPNNTRADTVVDLIEDVAKNAWEKII